VFLDRALPSRAAGGLRLRWYGRQRHFPRGREQHETHRGVGCLRDVRSAAVDPRCATFPELGGPASPLLYLNAYPVSDNCQELNKHPATVKIVITGIIGLPAVPA